MASTLLTTDRITISNRIVDEARNAPPLKTRR